MTMRATAVLGAAMVCAWGVAAWGQVEVEKFDQPDRFRQLDELLPTPNACRAASGAPGADYWQQEGDYEIEVALDDEHQHITGSERITYHNNSPDTLSYLWLQIDNNIFSPKADAVLAATAPGMDRWSFEQLHRTLVREEFDGSVNISSVTDDAGSSLDHTIVKTMMRVDLPEPLKHGESFVMRIEWDYRINSVDDVWGRTAAEHFDEDDNWIYEVAHWYPRMCVYSDVTGWQNKQFLGRGEFTLEFGNFDVAITVPDDHVVAATGVLQNPGEVLEPAWRERLAEARTAAEPVFIVTPEEAKANESSEPTGTKTWRFHADNVRDFAWASSRKFIWDAWGHTVRADGGPGTETLAMSFYPNEGEPLWSKYSTHVIVHTLDVYSRMTFDYPYPEAISVNGPVGGMEYPMICFNGPRPEKDGTYSKRTKYGLISVIIHEVGHNFFPMIVNSDERQWTWMDEGFNTFCQYLAEQQWEDGYPSRRGEPRDIVGYMTSADQVPIMTNSESLHQFGNNAYAKTATALNVLRESILGRDLFDFAFRQYAQRWMFKHPMPSDFFRTMEDASGIDLDWFWRGWFYTTDHVDVAITSVAHFTADTGDPDIDKGRDRAERDAEPQTLSDQRNAPLVKLTDRYPELLDFYNDFDELDVTDADRRRFEKVLDRLEDDEKAAMETDKHFYLVQFRNMGGLVTPLPLEIEYEGGGSEEVKIPAEIWKLDSERVGKLLVVDEPIERIVLDPNDETPDADRDNNTYPPEIHQSRFKLFKEKQRRNDMQKAQNPDKDDDEEDDG